MIVSTHDDVVRLSGALVKNQWLTIKAAANLLLQDHPEGIIIDCSELSHVSEDGAKTFLEAMRDIQAAGARIVVCALPDEVMRVVRSIPGVRSQLPVAATVEEARASLRLQGSALPTGAERQAMGNGVLVPLIEGLDSEAAVVIAARAQRELKLQAHLVYFLTIARNLPLTAPLPEAEALANQGIEAASATARKAGLVFAVHVERVRDPQEGILQAIRNYTAATVIVSAAADQANSPTFMDLVEALLHRAPCNVVIARNAQAAANGGTEYPH